MQEKESIPVPSAIRELINANNQLLNQYQQELTTKVYSANLEMMQILGLDPKEGWKVDTDRMLYVKEEPNTETD